MAANTHTTLATFGRCKVVFEFGNSLYSVYDAGDIRGIFGTFTEAVEAARELACTRPTLATFGHYRVVFDHATYSVYNAGVVFDHFDTFAEAAKTARHLADNEERETAEERLSGLRKAVAEAIEGCQDEEMLAKILDTLR